MPLSSKRKRGKDPEGGNEGEEEEEVGEVDPSITKSTRAAALAAYTGNGADLAKSLHTTSLDALRSGLTEIRTLTGKSSHDEKLSPSDKRIRLAQEFCQAGGIGLSSRQDNGKGILNAWDIIDSQDKISLLPIVLFTLSNIISLLGSHQPTHEYVDEMIQNLLPSESSNQEPPLAYIKSNIYWIRLQTYLANASSAGQRDASHKGKANQSQGSQEIVTMATLRLLLEMTSFAGGKYAKSVFDHMNWTMKVRFEYTMSL